MTPNNRKPNFPSMQDNWGNDFSNSNHDIFNRNEISASNNTDYHREDINELLNNISPHNDP